MRTQRMHTNLMRLLSAISTILIALLACTPGHPAAAASAGPEPVHTQARSAALIDVTSGRLLYSSAGDRRMKIASLTKIMTAIVAIENGRLTDAVKAGPRAVGKEGSSIYLKLNEEMSLENMLYGLMLRSGNDAATAIAEHVGGTEEGFVYLMNQKAAWLGLENTHFMNPHGLDHPDHYSSANDVAKLTAYALRNDVFREIVKTQVKSAPNPNETWDYKWLNKNKMLRLYEGADGVKTGYTKAALRCLVSSATRGGQQLAAVTLNDGDDWADHRKLLDWGFRNYPLVELASDSQRVAGQPVLAAKAFRYPLAAGERERVSARLELNGMDSLSYRLGVAGRLIFTLNGSDIGGIPVRTIPSVVPEDGSAGARRMQDSGEHRKDQSLFASAWTTVLQALFGPAAPRG